MIDQPQLESRRQLEISFAEACPFRPVVRQQKRLARARWWFSQMRSAVNQAMHREPAPKGQPEQTCLRLGPSKRF